MLWSATPPTARYCAASGSYCMPALPRDVEKSEAPTLLRQRLEIRLDEDLDGLFAGVDLDTNSLVAKVDLMAVVHFSLE
jgi:hypothetical protein